MNLKEKILKEALPSDKDYSTQRQEFIRKAMKRVGLTSVNKIRKSEDQENVFICDYIVHGELIGRTFIDLGNLLNCMVSFRPSSKNSLEITFAWHQNSFVSKK